VALAEVVEQYVAFERLKAGLGKVGTEAEIQQYLSEREEVELEAEMKPEAIRRFEERISRPSKRVGEWSADKRVRHSLTTANYIDRVSPLNVLHRQISPDRKFTT